ncbi:hypothetical protein BDV29DRAFT_161811 [Aspergillus leporis]|uniref:Uncharacterized protein n=1 Tax=Aspergillus leporis TaxID=41062 RepID=A0A5N5WMX1_9EURO|nr:hypothetical protein BDV29DRAFT_161811 [Aspergillus leporis]
MSWFSALLCCLGRRRKPDDLTSFSGEMPLFEAKVETSTFVSCIGGENVIVENRTIMEVKRFDDQGGRGSDENANGETKDLATCSQSVFGKSTHVGSTDAETRELGPPCESNQGTIKGENTKVEIPKVKSDYIFPCPSFFDDSTGGRMVDLIQVTTIGLDHCKIKGAESRRPNSDHDEIEVLFHYEGDNIWVYVPYGYVKDRDDFK